MTDAKNWKPQGLIGWSLTLVACLLAVLMAGLAYCMIYPVRWDGPGVIGALVLFFPLHLLIVTVVAAGLGFLAQRSGAGLAAWMFGLVVVMTTITASIPTGAASARRSPAPRLRTFSSDTPPLRSSILVRPRNDPMNRSYIMNKIALNFLLSAVLSVGCTMFAAAIGQAGNEMSEKPTITFDANAAIGAVSPLLFGANHRWVSSAAGSADPRTGFTYPRVVDQIKDVGISMIRYPAGTLGNLFQWQRAIGPQTRRGRQVSGLVVMPMPYDSKFGPDEYGDLLNKTGATGNLMINFATATAADAANFVAYMTAPQGSPPVNGVDWAARRAANGHPAPYKVAYVEIGNEYEPSIQSLIDQNYWILGEPVQINPACAADKISCLYAFGGSTRFVNQPAVQMTDWREPTSISSGAPRQTLYARYAPVTAGSETVFMNGVAWKGLSNLSAAAPDATVYQIDYKSGGITFGDGVHGAIPPKGAKVTVTYTSGPHEGFVDFYRAIKTANPGVKVCSSIHDESFIRIMGAQHAYDCIQQHPYVIGNPKVHTLSGGVNDFFLHMAARTMHLGSEVQHTQRLVKQHAGANANKVEMLLSEYGQLGTFPTYAPHFARSHGQAILNALCIREWVLNRVAAADRTVLTDYTFKPIPADLAAVQFSDSATAGDFALFGGPGPDTVITPPALAMKLLRQNMGDTLLTSSMSRSSKVSSSKGDSFDALQTFATRDAQGHVFLVVINADPQHAIRATIAPANLVHGPKVTVSTLASPNITDENNPIHPAFVAIKQRSVKVGTGNFDLVFSKLSITAIKLSP
jgi:alpha-N-arabinofuranosidase